MTREQLTSKLIALAMAFFLAFAGVACIVTGFELNVDMGPVVINLLIAVVIVTLAVSSGWGNLILAVVVALFVNHLWHREDLAESVETLIYWISARFNGAYQWGVIYWSAEPPIAADLEPALSVMAIPVIWVISWTVQKRMPAFFAVPLAIAMPAVCFVITNTVPAGWCLFLLCAGLLLLVLTQTVRRQSAADGNRLMAILLVPALLCTSLLFWAVPMEGYSPQFDMPPWLQELFAGSASGVPGSTMEPVDAVDLGTVGPKRQSKTEVMRVKTSNPGLLYLRGQAYDHYEGTTWSVSEVDTTKDRYWPTRNMTSAGEITITTRTEARLRYLPYYTSNGAWMNQIKYGRLEGAATKEYTFPIMDRAGVENLNSPVFQDEIVVQCKQLPESTKQKAEEILKQIGVLHGYSNTEKARLIGEYVKEVAYYNIMTVAMPKDQDDFAIWFLTEAETGYCVHFATAATVLLRAAGVPARYVTGYMVDVYRDTATVEQRDAHAWVEYLDDNRGWVVLDPTPVSEDPVVTEPSESTEPTTPTDPSESTEPTVSTDPSESTEPTESQGTEPTGSTEPSESTVPGQTQPSQGQAATQLDWSWLWNALKYTALILGPIGLIAGQYFLRIGLRKRKRRRLNTNQKALEDFREVIRLSRLLRQPISEELEELAEKARYSQHTLTTAECSEFRHRLVELREVLQSKNWFSRFVLKLVFAIQ